MEFLKEFWEFLKERKKYWLLPIIIVLALARYVSPITEANATAIIIRTLTANPSY